MKKITVIFIVILILFAAFTRPVHALTEEQSIAIQRLLDETSRKSGTPALSVSIVDGDETLYFSSGYANRERELLATENTLYELASVSKAFTGLGILLLEEQGLLSMTDPIQKYIPWLSFEYQGVPIDMQSVTLNHFLHHTSGLTNTKHFQDIPQGSSEDMLFKTVEKFKNTELEFPPGKQYAYGTVNYDVLGLVIEVVSDQSYESFMAEEIFQPLGLYNTYVYQEDADKSGQMAQGYRTSLFVTTPYDAPDYAGNKPAGYIIANSVDMARWMKIQMGIAKDVSEEFTSVIEKSHQGNDSVPDDEGMYYGAGWLVNSDRSIIEHDGVNPNFSSQVVIFPKEEQALSLLTNSANSNTAYLVESIKKILAGDLTQTYQISDAQLSDIILSIATIIFTTFAILIFLFGLLRKTRIESLRRKRRVLNTVLPTITLVMMITIWFFPRLMGYDWSTLLVWQSYSILTALLSLGILSASVTWFVWRVSK